MHLKIIFALLVLVFLVSCTVEQPSETSQIVTQQPQQTAPSVASGSPSQVQAPSDTQTSASVECYDDEDCGGREIIGDTNCFQGNVQGTVRINTCINPGKPDSYCDSETKAGIIKTCPDDQFCKQGDCLEYECSDSDGGLNFTVQGEVILNDGNVYEDKCSKEVLTEYYCSADNRAFSEQKTCPGECSTGRCKEAD